MFLSISAKGQNRIDGIGKLKLGMSFEQVREVVQSDIAMREHYWKVDDVKKFQVKRYEPVKGYYLKGMVLYFYKNQLFEIETSTSESGETNIDAALTIKYGEPKTEIKEEPKSFQNGFGAITTKTEITTFKEWKTNDPNIKCDYSYCASYTVANGKIYPYSVQLFSLVNNKIRKIVQDLDSRNRSKSEKEEMEKLKKLLEAL